MDAHPGLRSLSRRPNIREIFSYNSNSNKVLVADKREQDGDEPESKLDKGTLADLESPDGLDSILMLQDNIIHPIPQVDQEDYWIMEKLRFKIENDKI